MHCTDDYSSSCDIVVNGHEWGCDSSAHSVCDSVLVMREEVHVLDTDRSPQDTSIRMIVAVAIAGAVVLTVFYMKCLLNRKPPQTQFNSVQCASPRSPTSQKSPGSQKSLQSVRTQQRPSSYKAVPFTNNLCTINERTESGRCSARGSVESARLYAQSISPTPSVITAHGDASSGSDDDSFNNI